MKDERLKRSEILPEDKVAENINKLSPEDSKSFMKGILNSNFGKALLAAAMISLPGVASADNAKQSTANADVVNIGDLDLDDFKIDSNIKYQGKTYSIVDYGALVAKNYDKMMERFNQNVEKDSKSGDNIQVAQK